MKSMTKSISLTILALGLLTPAIRVQADTMTNPGNPTGGQFAKEHPRRNEVNKRVRHQRKRIAKDEASGKITPQEAQQLRANDNAIKQQEHADVKANGGYITKGEQKQLNQEENANSKLIKDEAHPVQ